MRRSICAQWHAAGRGEHMLDNPGYASLCGAHARFAQCARAGAPVRGRCGAVPRAAPPPPSSAGLAGRRRPRRTGSLSSPGRYERPPSCRMAWRAVRTFDLVQMIEERVTGVDCAEAIALGAADVPEMLGLVARPNRGRFSRGRSSSATTSASGATGRSWRWPASAFMSTAGRRSAPSAQSRTIVVRGLPLG